MQVKASEICNGHSMVGALRRVLVCSPHDAGWDSPERASQWHELGFGHAPDAKVATLQHRAMCRELESVGAEILYLPGTGNLSLDAVYAHDASLPTDYGWIALRPGKRNRVAEGGRQREFAEQSDIYLLGEVQAPGTAEGGDMVWLDSHTLLMGQGYRSNAAGIEQISALLQSKGITVIAAPLPYGKGPAACLHLMSLMSLLDETTAVVDLPWMAVETVELLRERFTFIEIDPSERDTLACNVLSLGGRRLLALEENRNTNERLRLAGFDVRTFAGSELCINGGGGPTCLTRPILRA